MAENEVQIPSFFDFDEPSLDEVGAPPEPEKNEPEKKEPVAEGSAPQNADFFQRLAQIDAEREQMRQAQVAESARQEENRKRWAALHTPPPLPEGEEAEKLVIDPEAVKNLIRTNQEWTQNLLRAYGSAMTQLRQETAQTIEQAQAHSAVAAVQAGRVSKMVADRLSEEGFDDIEGAMDEADAVLFADPNKYLSYRTSPKHFEQAVRFVMEQRQQEGRAPARTTPRRGIASGPSMPYSQAAPTTASAASSSGMSREDIAKAQRLLGHKFSATALRKAGVVG